MERSCHFGPAKAVHDVIVDETAGLHERVADRRPDEPEAALLQVLAHRLRLGGLGRDLAEPLPPVHPRLAADEAPQVLTETLQLEHTPRVVDCRLDLEPVPNNARITQEPLD